MAPSPRALVELFCSRKHASIQTNATWLNLNTWFLPLVDGERVTFDRLWLVRGDGYVRCSSPAEVGVSVCMQYASMTRVEEPVGSEIEVALTQDCLALYPDLNAVFDKYAVLAIAARSRDMSPSQRARLVDRFGPAMENLLQRCRAEEGVPEAQKARMLEARDHWRKVRARAASRPRPYFFSNPNSLRARRNGCRLARARPPARWRRPR